MSELFHISLDDLINSENPTKGELEILKSITDNSQTPTILNVTDFINLAPIVKPSLLEKMAQNLNKDGINISHIVILSSYSSDQSVLNLLENDTLETTDPSLIEKLVPFLDKKSKSIILSKIIIGELDWTLIKPMAPYIQDMASLIESVVFEGDLPPQALNIFNGGRFFDCDE